eukprot:38039-Rhodomonas_salina.1
MVHIYGRAPRDDLARVMLARDANPDKTSAPAAPATVEEESDDGDMPQLGDGAPNNELCPSADDNSSRAEVTEQEKNADVPENLYRNVKLRERATPEDCEEAAL